MMDNARLVLDRLGIGASDIHAYSIEELITLMRREFVASDEHVTALDIAEFRQAVAWLQFREGWEADRG